MHLPGIELATLETWWISTAKIQRFSPWLIEATFPLLANSADLLMASWVSLFPAFMHYTQHLLCFIVEERHGDCGHESRGGNTLARWHQCNMMIRQWGSGYTTVTLQHTGTSGSEAEGFCIRSSSACFPLRMAMCSHDLNNCLAFF